MAKSKRSKEVHVARTKYGSGDYMGTGIKNKVGKIRSVFGIDGQMNSSQLKTPPKSLA